MVRPMSDLGLYLAAAAEWPSYDKQRDWLRDNDRFRRDILELLGSSGPVSSRDIPDTCVVPWASTGWSNNRNVTQMLEFLMMRGEVAIAGRLGRERLWDLPERVYPADVAVPSVEEAERRKNERRHLARHARQKARGGYGAGASRRWGYYAPADPPRDRLIGKLTRSPTAMPPCCGSMRSTRREVHDDDERRAGRAGRFRPRGSA
jgi:hypothetical protein